MNKKDQSLHSPSLNPTNDKKETSRYQKSDTIKSLERIDNEIVSKLYPTLPYLEPKTYSDATNCIIQAHKDYQIAMEIIGAKYVSATSSEHFKDWYDSSFKENTA